MEIVLANASHLQDVAKLFDQYRVFYNQPPNLQDVEQFLAERFRNQDSSIFLALDTGVGVGFTQLYPSFSSISMRRIWILNDLFVLASHRRQGIAKQLMQAAVAHAQETGAIRIALATQKQNIAAQALYTSLGYQLEQDFNHLTLSL